MISHLLDTSVYSQPLRSPGSRVPSAVIRWQQLGDAAVAVSAVTRAEVEVGLRLRNVGGRRRLYSAVLAGRVTVLPTSRDVWYEFVNLKCRQIQVGQRVGDFDLLIAATARVHHLTVATLDRRDFSRVEGLLWEDWSV
jgi:tRNA(fMet)-specific endonuclease VapC